MGFDIIVKGGILPDGSVADIGISGDRIAAIEPAIAGRGRHASSTPPATWSRRPSSIRISTWMRRSPTAFRASTRRARCSKASALWGELKPLLTHEAVRERALAYCDWAVSMGLLAIRSHVDTCDDRLLAVEALLEVKKRSRPISTCSSSPSRRTASTARRRRAKTPSARSTWASISSAASRISSAPWRTAAAR